MQSARYTPLAEMARGLSRRNFYSSTERASVHSLERALPYGTRFGLGSNKHGECSLAWNIKSSTSRVNRCTLASGPSLIGAVIPKMLLGTAAAQQPDAHSCRRPKTISIPSVRRKVCARRSRPAIARGSLASQPGSKPWNCRQHCCAVPQQRLSHDPHHAEAPE
jgi:hypothetical protein